jgi:hypothetical protein
MAVELSPGTIYAHLDDALTAASCLCGLDDKGATIYGTTERALACAESGEAYIVAVDVTQVGGKGWTVPPAPYRPIYTITRAGRG